jgi:hypothetical protein
MSVPLRQNELVQDTWERVEPVSETAARMFYDRLFELNPQLRALFPAEKEEMEEQGRKPMQKISIAVPELDRLDELSPAVEDLGAGTSLTVYGTRTTTPPARRFCGRWSRAWVRRSSPPRSGRPGVRPTLYWPVS